MKKILLLVALLAVFHGAPAYATAAIGEPAPALIVPEINGDTFDLSALHGKVVLVHYWATWCMPCKEQMPALDAVYHTYHAQGLEVIAISLDKAKHHDDMINMMKAFSFPAAFASDIKTNDFGTPDSLPVTYVIDAGGMVHATFTTGEINEKSISDLVEPLLKRKI